MPDMPCLAHLPGSVGPRTTAATTSYTIGSSIRGSLCCCCCCVNVSPAGDAIPQDVCRGIFLCTTYWIQPKTSEDTAFRTFCLSMYEHTS